MAIKVKKQVNLQCLDYVCVDNASGCQPILKGGDKTQKAASLLLRLDKRAVQRQNSSFTAKDHSQFSPSLTLISLSGYCIFCSPHAIAVVLRTSEIMLGPNPSNHFEIISLGTAHPAPFFFFFFSLQVGIRLLVLPDFLPACGRPAQGAGKSSSPGSKWGFNWMYQFVLGNLALLQWLIFPHAAVCSLPFAAQPFWHF